MKTCAPKFAPSVACFVRAARCSRCWSVAVGRAIARYGDVPGTHTSGVYNPDWPEPLKNGLRRLARAVHDWNAKGLALRPRYSRESTLHGIAHSVVARDGGGYYGYRV